ncbi:MAG: hypothetical protein WC528_03705 [Patescibacteria group bacterium]
MRSLEKGEDPLSWFFRRKAGYGRREKRRGNSAKGSPPQPEVKEVKPSLPPATREEKCVGILKLLDGGEVRLKDLPRLMKLPGVNCWGNIREVVEDLEREGRVVRFSSAHRSVMLARAKITYVR